MCKAGQPVDCSSQGDACNKGACDPQTGACGKAPLADGTSCDDGLACTSGDGCGAGACTGTALVCDDGVACTLDACDEALGGCVHDSSACGCEQDSDCDDANACNGVETCDPQSLTCKAGAPVDCSHLTQGCMKGSCSPGTGACSAVAVADGAGCDDGQACTTGDACKAGSCEGQPVTCDDGLGCTVDACDEASGACASDDSGCDCLVDADCDDLNPCNGQETCDTLIGECVAGAVVDCTSSDDACNTGACDPATGACVKVAVSDGTACDDASICTQGDVCSDGVCQGVATPCDDGKACTVDSCSERAGGCVFDASACGCTADAQCDDGNPCNGVETCDLSAGQCKSGAAVSCVHLDDACNLGVCSPSTGQCAKSPKANGLACNDGNACTQTDQCQSGVCTGSNPVVCTAQSQCHQVGVCDAATGVCSNPVKTNGSSCNDGNACTQTDSCQNGACVGSNLKSCTALSQCHNAGVCNTVTGACSTPLKPNGSACDDDDACTASDVCSSGTCVGSGTPDDAPNDWAKRISGGSSDGVTSVVSTTNGGVLVAGSFSSTSLNLGTTSSGSTKSLMLPSGVNEGLFLASYDSNGNVGATKLVGQSPDSTIRSTSLMVTDGGDVLLAGWSLGTVQVGASILNEQGGGACFLVRMSSALALKWVVSMKGFGCFVVAAVDGSGNTRAMISGSELVLSSTAGDTETFSFPQPRGVLAAYDSLGGLEWTSVPFETGDVTGYGIAVSALGDSLITGRASSTTVSGQSIASAGGYDAFALRVGQDGDPEWFRRMGGTGADQGFGAAFMADGKAIVTGRVIGAATISGTGMSAVAMPAGASGTTDQDVFVAAFDSLGQSSWVLRSVGAGDDVGYAVAPLGSTDGVSLVGTLMGSMTLGVGANAKFLATAGGLNSRALFAAQVTAGGQVKFLEHIGGENALHVGWTDGFLDPSWMAVASDASGAMTVGGTFKSATQFGAAKMTSLSAVGHDGYLARINSADGLQCQ